MKHGAGGIPGFFVRWQRRCVDESCMLLLNYFHFGNSWFGGHAWAHGSFHARSAAPSMRESRGVSLWQGGVV